ncbi:MAG: ParA family protein [Chlamydiales bacterium]|nr:ParA family protein [Chlamydiales bacterium]MBY0529927.1 ParA family protein [Rhabdochlamydiaceae bacterium]
MRTITFCSFKGGTAKTSTTLHIGACLAKKHKKKVLLVDFDSQANLSTGLGLGQDNLKTMVPVLQGEESIRDVIQETHIKNLSIIPANAYLDGIEKTPQVGADLYAHERLRRALKTVEEDYDFCFIDTPPSLSWLTQSAFFASQFTIICAIPEAYSVLALRRLKDFLASFKQYHEIDVLGLIFSFWDERGAVNKAFLEEITNSFPDKLFSSRIRRDVAVSRAVLQGKPVFETDPDCRASEDYKLVTAEFLKRLENGSSSQKIKHLLNEQTKAGV